jgi:hypothetical protein
MSDTWAGPWSVDDPTGWWSAWARMWPGPRAEAPQVLTQPILPGWTIGPVITVNEANSSSPQTEADIVARHSYGRQLGHLADAVSALVGERSKDAPADERITAFTTMTREIEQVKLDAAAARVERLLHDLAQLKEARPDDYRRLRSALDAALNP